MSQNSAPPAGWYADPQGGDGERWWNGLAWTATTRPGASSLQSAPNPAPAAPSAPSAPSAPTAATVPAYPLPPTAYRVNEPAAPAAVPPFHAVAPYDPSRGAVQPAGQASYGAYPPYGAPLPPAPPVHSLGDAVRTVFAKYATFEGRATRSEYWYWALFNVLISFAAVVVILISLLFGITAVIGILLYIALIGWSLAVFIPTLAVSVRRLRDSGYPWALLFLAFVPFGSIVLLVLYAQPSKQF